MQPAEEIGGEDWRRKGALTPTHAPHTYPKREGHFEVKKTKDLPKDFVKQISAFLTLIVSGYEKWDRTD